MSSGLQHYIRRQTPVQAVRYDGTNRSQIEQWMAAEGLEYGGAFGIGGAEWVAPSWVVFDPAAGNYTQWWSDAEFIATYQPVTAKQAEVIAAEETT